MRDETEIRDLLIELSEQVRPSGEPERIVWARVRRRRRRRAAGAVVLATVSVLSVAAMMPGVLGALRSDTNVGSGFASFDEWPTVGNAVDSDLATRAAIVWDSPFAPTDAVSPGPHSGTHALLATRDPSLGAVVVLHGYDAEGVPRLAFFTGQHPATDAPLVLRADRPAPNAGATDAVSLVSARLTGEVGTVNADYWGAYAVAVARPGVDTVRLLSTTVDQELAGDPDSSPKRRYEIRPLPASSTAITTTVVGYRGGRERFRTPADTGAFGDAVPVPATVVARSPGKLTLAIPDGYLIRPGQLAAAANGLVGRVASVDAATGHAELTTVESASFRADAYTDIHGYHGAVRGTGADVVFAIDAVEASVNVGNRILVPDPAQGDPRAGALTIGRATTNASAVTRTVDITVAADLSQLETIYVMTPPA